jgi:hypothetical protein
MSALHPRFFFPFLFPHPYLSLAILYSPTFSSKIGSFSEVQQQPLVELSGFSLSIVVQATPSIKRKACTWVQ